MEKFYGWSSDTKELVIFNSLTGLICWGVSQSTLCYGHDPNDDPGRHWGKLENRVWEWERGIHIPLEFKAALLLVKE